MLLDMLLLGKSWLWMTIVHDNELIKSTSQKEQLIGYIQNSEECSLLKFGPCVLQKGETCFGSNS